jgi:hypothetical protein
MLNRISRAFEVPARAWCKLMHPDPMWPVGGFYRCPECLRQYPVQWESQPQTAVADIRVTALRPELLPLRIKTVPVPVERQPIRAFTATTVG